jgi:hypothetical protein
MPTAKSEKLAPNLLGKYYFASVLQRASRAVLEKKKKHV